MLSDWVQNQNLAIYKKVSIVFEKCKEKKALEEWSLTKNRFNKWLLKRDRGSKRQGQNK